MNRSRCILFLGLLLFTSFPLPSGAPSALADTPAPDSTAAPDSFLTIYPVKGEWFEASYVSYWSMDSFRYRKVSGETGYLTANKIRSIEDAEGNDVFAFMLEKRISFGSPGADNPRSFSGWFKRPFLTKPHRLRSGYLVLEMGASIRASGENYTGRSGTLFTTGIGGIKNLSPRWGLGGVVQFIAAADDYRAAAVGVRVRRYLSDSYAVETTQGIFGDSNRDGRAGRGVPYFGEVALSAAGTVSLFTRIERHQYSFTRYFLGYYPQEYEVSETALHFGLRLGPRPSYLTVPGFVAGVLTAISSGGKNVY